MRLSRLVATLLATLLAAGCMSPEWGAGALLHPQRRPVGAEPAIPHRAFTADAEGVALRGWFFPGAEPRSGVAVVYLHGIGDNRASGTWVAERLVARGLDVVTFDGRAHGESGGEACTYGFHERHDVGRILDALGLSRAVLLGVSLGGAVALQAAAEEPRVIGVVAVAPFSDLEAIARERAPPVATDRQVRQAFALAEREGRFQVSEVSPVRSAARIHAPVLLVHGTRDRGTRPAHSERILQALVGPRRLILVDGAGHHDAMSRAWPDIEAFVTGLARGGGDAATH